VTKAKQTGARVTFIEDTLCSNRSVELAGSFGGASKAAIALLVEKHVQDH
jgi:hypothetical protein